MRFASLGSGSQGNGLVVEAGNTRVLLDCGFTLKETIARLHVLGVEADSISAVLVTHEHADHINGVARFARKFSVPVWLTHGTLRAAKADLAALSQNNPAQINLFDPHRRFSINDIELEPYPVPHDAHEPVQFVFGDGRTRLGVLTDAGCATPHIEAVLSRCQALVLECNHDQEMLANSSYPHSLKQRIGGRLGHFENSVSAALLAKLDNSLLQHIIAAHLSVKNNTPALARAALSNVLNCVPEWIGVADQATGFGWREIN